MPKDIVFPEIEPRYVFEGDCLAFSARVDGKCVECLVTLELLMARFGAREPSEQAMRQAYHDHRAAIQDIARSHLEHGWVDEESRLFLTTRFTRLSVTLSESSHDRGSLRASVEAAHRMLTDLIGPNAEEVTVDWDVEDRGSGVEFIRVQITDPSLPYTVKVVLGPKVWQDDSSLSFQLASAWGDVLRARSRKLLLKSG